MKKFSAMLLSLGLLLLPCACAFTGSGYPAWNGSAPPQNGFCAYFGEDMLQLEFDSAQEYSYIQDGLLTACFFAFDAAQQNYLEMYMELPESLAAGDVYTSADGRGDSSISLYEVSLDGESLYYAGQLIGMAYPGGSEYEITIDSAVQESGTLTVQGHLQARLCRIENNMITDEFLALKDAAFHFSMPLLGTVQPRQSFAPEASPQPFAAPETTQPPFTLPDQSQFPRPEATPRAKAPAYTMDPHPAFTLPPDYRVI